MHKARSTREITEEVAAAVGQDLVQVDQEGKLDNNQQSNKF